MEAKEDVDATALNPNSWQAIKARHVRGIKREVVVLAVAAGTALLTLWMPPLIGDPWKGIVAAIAVIAAVIATLDLMLVAFHAVVMLPASFAAWKTGEAAGKRIAKKRMAGQH